MAEQAVTATSGSTSKTSRLIISIDVGITQSAVAVAYLPPGIPQSFMLRTHIAYLFG